MHHGIFRRVQYANRLVMRVNLLLLMAVAFLPFPTKLVAKAIRDTSAERAAVIRHWRRRTAITDTGLRGRPIGSMNSEDAPVGVIAGLRIPVVPR